MPSSEFSYLEFIPYDLVKNWQASFVSSHITRVSMISLFTWSHPAGALGSIVSWAPTMVIPWFPVSRFCLVTSLSPESGDLAYCHEKPGSNHPLLSHIRIFRHLEEWESQVIWPIVMRSPEVIIHCYLIFEYFGISRSERGKERENLSLSIKWWSSQDKHWIPGHDKICNLHAPHTRPSSEWSPPLRIFWVERSGPGIRGGVCGTVLLGWCLWGVEDRRVENRGPEVSVRSPGVSVRCPWCVLLLQASTPT